MLQYDNDLLTFFRHTVHQGELENNMPGNCVATVGADDNQDILKLSLQLDDNKIIKARFLAKGSVAIIGGAEWLCQYLEGKNRVDVMESLNAEMVLNTLQLPKVKIHIAYLLCRAVRECMDGYD